MGNRAAGRLKLFSHAGDFAAFEKTMQQAHNGVPLRILSYCLIAYSPWEGLRVAITGTKGRLEMEIVENINHLLGDGQANSTGASKTAFKNARIRVYPMFGEAYEVDVPVGDGGHGGADPVMLEQLFSPNPPPDPLNRAASHIDGAASVLVGIAANLSMKEERTITISDLFTLPEKEAASVTSADNS